MPVTIVNRFGQKSLSLPRIDDRKRWAGYPGITGVSRKIAKLVPKTLIDYVEPFAGTAKVYQELKNLKGVDIEHFVLNDKSTFIYEWLRKEFATKHRMFVYYGDTIVTKQDFVKCFKEWDSKNSFFLIDPPWYKTYYDQTFSHFDRDSVKEYDKQVLEICERLRGKFIITTRKENKIMLNSRFTNKLIKSEYVVSGKYPKVLITTNLELNK